MHQPKFVDQLIKAQRYDIIVYGHTHRIDIRKETTLVVNPGECGGWLTGKNTIAILDTTNSLAELVNL